MIELIRNLRRLRNYHPREKWWVFGGLAVITLVIWSVNSVWLDDTPANKHTVSVSNLSVPSDVVKNEGFELATIQLTDKNTSQPVSGVWVGLRISDKAKRSPSYTYYDWYSPKAGRAFFPTNEEGEVYFPLESELDGEVEYDIYVGNPDVANYAKYQSLDTGFRVNYH
ncbi:MAG: hypothetical protein R3B38_01440 [Patescibacteria group bacterium]